MLCKQFQVPVGFGVISGQIFGNADNPNSKPIVSLHGYLDNSNSFRPVANYITQANNNYYIIAIDLPGMGLSSKLPDGIPYAPKIYLMCVRRVIKHFNLTKFTFMSHSFGCSLSFAYSTCYNEEVESLILFDFAMHDLKFDRKDDIAECWRDNIETYLKAEKTQQEKHHAKKKQDNQELTYDFALSRLLQANPFIDENAAKILLERGLIESNDKLEYSRDIRLVSSVSRRDYHAEFATLWPSVFETLEAPVFWIYATPPPYGEAFFADATKLIEQIRKAPVERYAMEGGHHFHLMQPDEAAKLVLAYLQKRYDINDNIVHHPHLQPEKAPVEIDSSSSAPE